MHHCVVSRAPRRYGIARLAYIMCVFLGGAKLAEGTTNARVCSNSAPRIGLVGVWSTTSAVFC